MIIATIVYTAIAWLIWPLSFARFTAVLIMLFAFSAAMNTAHP
ncbi:hypothetical protein [Stutzerimonas nitrititolerans]|nr:hypothetical protein [Stutzerimonas nitrititolerans]